MPSTQVARSLRRRASWGWAAGLLTLLAALLRFGTLDRQSFWSDEAITVLLVRMDVFEMLRTTAETEATPPLYYVLAWAWTRLFGDGEIGLRSLSAFAGTATVPVAYAAGSIFFGRRGAVAAAALVAVSPTLVWYSQEARSYALAILLCAASFASFGHVLRGGPSPLALGVWTATSLLALGTHYFAVFVVATEALWLLVSLRSRATVWALGVVSAGGVALLPLALTQRGQGFVEYQGAADSIGVRITVVAKQLLVGESLPYDRAIAVAVAFFLLTSCLLLVPRVGDDARRAFGIALTVGAAPIVLPLALSLVDLDYLNTRNALVGLVPATVAFGGILSAPRPGAAGAVAVAGLSGVLCAVTLAVAIDPSHHRPNWRGLAREIREAKPPQIVVVTPDHQGWFARVPLRVYLPEARAVDSRYADAVPQFARVSRRPVDNATPRHVLARAVVVAGVGWALPELPRPLPSAFEAVENRRAHGYRFVRHESTDPVLLRTSSLVSSQAAVVVVSGRGP